MATSVELRYCDSCDLFQPPRCWHCAVCENCVLQFDHHCPWIGNCVGQRNYHYFFCLILFSTMTLLYTIVLCIVQIVTVTRADENYVTLSNILSAVLLLFTFVLSWSTITLLGFHTYLVIRNLTTYEHIRLVGLGSFAAGTKSKNSNGKGLLFRAMPETFCRTGDSEHSSLLCTCSAKLFGTLAGLECWKKCCTFWSICIESGWYVLSAISSSLYSMSLVAYRSLCPWNEASCEETIRE